MTGLRRSKALILIILLLPMVLSCAEMKDWRSSTSDIKPSSTTDELSQPSRQPSVQAVNLAKAHVAAGQYQKAINVYNVAYQDQPHDRTLVIAYVNSIEDIASAANQAFDKQDVASAGMTYDVLLKNYSQFKGFHKALSFDSALLNEKLDYCKKALFKEGFQEYRNGNLSEAIVLWQDLLAIDPHNTDIQEALRTAKLQQKNLREQE